MAYVKNSINISCLFKINFLKKLFNNFLSLTDLVFVLSNAINEWFRRVGRVVMQRIANPLTRVRFTYTPPNNPNIPYISEINAFKCKFKLKGYFQRYLLFIIKMIIITNHYN